MRKIYTIAFLLVTFFSKDLFAQAPDWIWVQGTCANGYQYGQDIHASPSGYVYTGGRLTGGNSSLGTLTVNSPGTCGFGGKFTPSSQFIWANAYFHSSFDYLYSFTRDDNGNLYSAGESQGGGPTSWAQRTDSNGVLNWSVTSSGKAFAIGADRWGNIYWAGMYSGSMTFGSTTISSLGQEDIFLVKYNSAGVVQWAKDVGGTGEDRILKSIQADKSGNIYFSGMYNGSPNYGGVQLAASSGYENYYIAKFDSTGNAVWVTTVNSAGPDPSYDNGDDFKLDSLGNIYVTSTFQGTTSFGSTSLTSAGGDDIFVGKLDNNGNWLWAKRAGGTSAREEGCGIALGRNFDVFVIGIYQNTANFGAFTLVGQGVNKDNAFVAKYDNATGNEIWVQTAGDASGDNNGYGITVDKYNYVYVTGDFASRSVFGTNTITATGGDLYIAKLDTVAGFQTTAVPDSTYCPGSSSQLIFNINRPFYAGNTFTAQLSDSTGSFTSPVNIGTLSSINGGTINIVIPGGTPTGSKYKIRVISSNPVDTNFSYSCVHDILTPIFNAGSTKISSGGITAKVSNDTSICSGSFVQLQASGGSTYSWSPGATLNDSTSANPYAAPTSPQIYTVVISSGSCGSDTAKVRVNVYPVANISVSPANTTACQGVQIPLTATGATSYTWTPAAGLSCATCANPVATPAISTTYSVTGNNGVCSNTFLDTINVGNLTIGGIVTAVRDTICQNTPGNLTLAGNSSNAIQWQSSTDDINFTNTPGTTANYKTAPLQQTTWYRAAVGAGNCSAISDTLRLYVPPPLVASFYFTQPSANRLAFNSDSSSGKIRSYHWDFGDGGTSNDSNPSYTYAKDSTYYVCLTLFDGSNCSYTFCRYSEVTDGLPAVSAAGNWIIYPNPFSAQLTISSKQTNNIIQNIEMYDVLGRVVINRDFGNTTNTSLQLDVSSLAKGMYYVMIKTADADYVQKVVKQ